MRALELAVAPSLPPGVQMVPDFNRLLGIIEHLAQLTKRGGLHVGLHSVEESFFLTRWHFAYSFVNSISFITNLLCKQDIK